MTRASLLPGKHEQLFVPTASLGTIPRASASSRGEREPLFPVSQGKGGTSRGPSCAKPSSQERVGGRDAVCLATDCVPNCLSEESRDYSRGRMEGSGQSSEREGEE